MGPRRKYREDLLNIQSGDRGVSCAFQSVGSRKSTTSQEYGSHSGQISVLSDSVKLDDMDSVEVIQGVSEAVDHSFAGYMDNEQLGFGMGGTS